MNLWRHVPSARSACSSEPQAAASATSERRRWPSWAARRPAQATGQNAFSFPAPTLDDAERRAFEVGDSFFTQNWVIAPASTDARDGLGPLFNAQACASCHLHDGRGFAGPTGGDAVGLLLRLSVPGTNEHGGPWATRSTATSSRTTAFPASPPRAASSSTTKSCQERSPTEPRHAPGPTYEIADLAYGDLPADIMVSPAWHPR